jgi:hypothetical protein
MAAVAKAHDLRVATIEALVGRDPSAMAPLHTLRSLEALRRVEGIKSLTDAWDWVAAMMHELPLLVAVAGQVAKRPDTYELRNRKAEWTRIYGQQTPRAIQSTVEAYTAVGVAAATLYTLLVDKTAQVSRTVAHYSNQVNDSISRGIRRKRHLLVRDDQSLAVAINQEILAGNRAFYRERYRRAGRVWQILGKHARDPDKAKTCRLEAAWWFARSDIANGVTLNVEVRPPEPVLPEKKVKSMIAVYLWSLRDDVGARQKKISELSLEATYRWASEVASDTHIKCRVKDYPLMLESAVDRLLESQKEDYMPLAETVVPKIPTGDGQTAAQLFGGDVQIPTFVGVTVDAMVSYWIARSGQGGFLDDDEVDTFVKWLDAHLGDTVTDVASYITVHSENLEVRVARDLLDDWWEKWEDDQMNDGDAATTKFDIE